MKNSFIIGGLALVAGIFLGVSYTSAEEMSEEVVVDYGEEFELLADTMSFDSVLEEVKAYNWKFPHVVFAQFLLESGTFSSSLVRTNNNFAGMKVAVRRLTTANKTDLNVYAHYTDYKHCVVDRALYEASFLRNITSEEEYYKTVSRVYAEDGSYERKLRMIVEAYKLKELF